MLKRLVVVAVAAIATVIAVQASKARDVGQWEATDPAIREWYGSLKQPDNPGISCCGESDAYWADKTIVEGGKVYAVITDTRPDAPLARPHIPPGTRVEIPPHKMTWRQGNPTGHKIIFLGPNLHVYCFVDNGGV